MINILMQSIICQQDGTSSHIQFFPSFLKMILSCVSLMLQVRLELLSSYLTEILGGTPESHCTKVEFTNFPFGGFTIDTIMNQLDRKLPNTTSVHCYMTLSQFGKFKFIIQKFSMFWRLVKDHDLPWGCLKGPKIEN